MRLSVAFRVIVVVVLLITIGRRRAACVFFFNDTATTEIYTLSLHDALPICDCSSGDHAGRAQLDHRHAGPDAGRSEEHTSELQTHLNLVCRLLLEKKNHRSSRSGRRPRGRTPRAAGDAPPAVGCPAAADAQS